MTRRIPAVCVVLVLLGAVPATAQPVSPENFKGLTEVQLMVESRGEDASECGLSENLLRTSATSASGRQSGVVTLFSG